MANSLFQLPEEVILTTISQTFPCRDAQIRALGTLLHPTAAPCRNLVVYGTESTGKSTITAAVLEKLGSEQLNEDGTGLQHTIVNSAECITSRHLFETIVAKVAAAIRWEHPPSKCETVSQLNVELSKMLKYTSRPDGFRFVLVFDGIDRQREAPATLIPALARLSEIITCLTSVFIVTSPPANFLRTAFAPHLHFPNYTKHEFVTILSKTPPSPLPNTTSAEISDLWTRFTAAVHDALARAASRTLPVLLDACLALWPRFTAPILAGTHTPREFSKLIVASRIHFQDEHLLDPTLASATAPTNPTKPASSLTDLASLLPTTARLLLLASYLASHNASKHDLTLFSTHHHGRKRRRGGISTSINNRGPRSKHKKIAKKLLGGQTFVLERMLAIFAAVRGDWDSRGYERDGEVGGDNADVGMGIATLASLRLLVKVGGQGGGDVLERGGKWRVNLGWEVVRGLGRSMGVEVEDWLVE